MTFLEMLERIDEYKEQIAKGGGSSFQRPVGYNEDGEQIWKELCSYDDSTLITPADIFATDWEEW